MRDRLIELIIEGHKRYLYYDQIAEYLLAEGVIVPPVELGSRKKVYYPVKRTAVILETKVYGIGVDEDGNTIINPIEYPANVISMIGVVFGKDVFLTREEAEKALAEREGKG